MAGPRDGPFPQLIGPGLCSLAAATCASGCGPGRAFVGAKSISQMGWRPAGDSLVELELSGHLSCLAGRSQGRRSQATTCLFWRPPKARSGQLLIELGELKECSGGSEGRELSAANLHNFFSFRHLLQLSNGTFASSSEALPVAVQVRSAEQEPN